MTLKVMSFNLYWGAGVDRRFDENVRHQYRGRDRSSELIAFLQDAAPDVLAVQEAAGWNGDPAFARQVADALGMSYVLAPDAWDLHVVLFSKYPIVAADYVSRLQDFNGVALRATLAIAENVHVNVLAVHLNSMSPDTRTCQVEALLDMAAGLEGRTILLGDMNFRPTHPQANLLRLSGWQLVRAQDRWPIDQIWLDEPGSYTIGDWWEGVDAPNGISDHWPVGAEIGFAATPSDVGLWREPVTEPGALAYACALP